MVIAIVGSGGKTTLLKQKAEAYRRMGRKVFVTTSTHMFIEPDTVLSDDPKVIIEKLETDGYVMAGIPDGVKIRALSPDTYAAVCSRADVALVEADGSKHMPIKFPNETEPVIYDNTDEIWVVCGLHALGRPVREVAHRLELVRQCLGISDETPITPAHVLKLVTEGYVKPMRQKYPQKKIVVFPAHDQSPAQRAVAEWIAAETTPYL